MTHDELKEIIIYDPITGRCTWNQKIASCIVIGSEAGSLRSNGKGYEIQINGKKYELSRIIWFWMTGKDTDKLVDHKNGDRNDNRWDNLREATYIENSQNRAISSRNTSGHTGVKICNRTKTTRYKAFIGLNGVSYHLGFFDNIDDAVAARKAKEHELYGEFAVNLRRRTDKNMK